MVTKSKYQKSDHNGPIHSIHAPMTRRRIASTFFGRLIPHHHHQSSRLLLRGLYPPKLHANHDHLLRCRAWCNTMLGTILTSISVSGLMMSQMNKPTADSPNPKVVPRILCCTTSNPPTAGAPLLQSLRLSRPRPPWGARALNWGLTSHLRSLCVPGTHSHFVVDKKANRVDFGRAERSDAFPRESASRTAACFERDPLLVDSGHDDRGVGI